MSVNLSIKRVPPEIAQRLRERAARNHRSLQRELMSIIEAAARESSTEEPSTQTVRRAPTPRSHTDKAPLRRGTKTIDEVVDEIRRRHPEPVADAPLAVDILRETRDSR